MSLELTTNDDNDGLLGGDSIPRPLGPRVNVVCIHEYVSQRPKKERIGNIQGARMRTLRGTSEAVKKMTYRRSEGLLNKNPSKRGEPSRSRPCGQYATSGKATANDGSSHPTGAIRLEATCRAKESKFNASAERKRG